MVRLGPVSYTHLITELTPLLQETRELAALTAHYYDRSYHRHERYTPVSYTHLDVYKRQLRENPA